MEIRIKNLLKILNNYSIQELSKIYRDKEVELEIESFTKHPDVRWSESLKKRMIQAAKRKRIAPGRSKYLEEQIKKINNYKLKEHIQDANNDLILMVKNLQRNNFELKNIVLLHIEFSDFNNKAYVQAYGKYKNKWYENEFGGFETEFISSKYWNEVETSKFSNMSEQLEIIEIEGEEWPSIFIEIWELRVFNAIKKASEQLKINDLLNRIVPNARIEIGIHDCEFYTIHKAYAT